MPKVLDNLSPIPVKRSQTPSKRLQSSPTDAIEPFDRKLQQARSNPAPRKTDEPSEPGRPLKHAPSGEPAENIAEEPRPRPAAEAPAAETSQTAEPAREQHAADTEPAALESIPQAVELPLAPPFIAVTAEPVPAGDVVGGPFPAADVLDAEPQPIAAAARPVVRPANPPQVEGDGDGTEQGNPAPANLPKPADAPEPFPDRPPVTAAKTDQISKRAAPTGQSEPVSAPAAGLEEPNSFESEDADPTATPRPAGLKEDDVEGTDSDTTGTPPAASRDLPTAARPHHEPPAPAVQPAAPEKPEPLASKPHVAPQPTPAPHRAEGDFASANHERIVSAVRAEHLPGGGTMRIRLDPPELGALQVTVRMLDGVMTASFETSNDQATRLLSHSLGQLKQALETQGVSVEKLHVQQAPRNEQAGADSDDPRHQRESQSDDERSRQEQQRQEMLRRMWRRLGVGYDPLDMVA